MGIPIASEVNKSKELLLEIDSIVPDTKGHHLADVSLSSNDSLSRSRRRWKLIKIISKMNPNFQGKSKKLIFYQSLSAVLSLILMVIVIYWLVQMKTTSSSSSELPLSSFLVSSRPSSSSSSSPSSTSSTSTGQSLSTEPPTTVTFGLPDNFDSFEFDPSSMLDNPILRLFASSNDTNDGVILKITDPVTDDSDEKSDDDEADSHNFPPSLPFPPFPSFPSDWFEASLDGPLILPPFIPPPPSSFQVVGPLESRSDIEPPTPIPDPFDEPFRPSTINLEKIRSSAQRLHTSALEALNNLMKKVKGSPLFDALVNDNLEPELVVRSDDEQDDGSLVGFGDDNSQLDDPVDHLFSFMKNMGF